MVSDQEFQALGRGPFSRHGLGIVLCEVGPLSGPTTGHRCATTILQSAAVLSRWDPRRGGCLRIAAVRSVPFASLEVPLWGHVGEVLSMYA